MRLYHASGSLDEGRLCAPYAVSALSGKPADPYIKRGKNGKTKGLSHHEIMEAMAHAGVPALKAAFIPSRLRMTVQRLVALGGAGILSINAHAIAFNEGLVNDTFSGGRWVWPPDHRFARSKVRFVRYSKLPRRMPEGILW